MENQELFTNGKSNFLFIRRVIISDRCVSGRNDVLERQQIHVLTIESTQPDNKARERKRKADASNVLNLHQKQDKAVCYSLSQIILRYFEEGLLDKTKSLTSLITEFCLRYNPRLPLTNIKQDKLSSSRRSGVHVRPRAECGGTDQTHGSQSANLDGALVTALQSFSPASRVHVIRKWLLNQESHSARGARM